MLRHTPVRRRLLLMGLVLLTTGVATGLMADLLWPQGMRVLEWVLLVLFALLFAHISFGFWQSVIGFVLRRMGGDPVKITSLSDLDNYSYEELPPTAIVMPIYQEPVERVYEGLRSLYHSLERSGHLEHFDFFLLSDSQQPQQWLEEEAAWVELCKQLKAFGRIFYRRRKLNINQKSGNITDFCRRWGKNYRYMLVLDADSVMDANTVLKMTASMELHPKVGLIQTAPRVVRAETVFGRMQQFANVFYGRLFAVGLNYWQLCEGNYWGHNAIIRLAPFMEHCALPDLPEKAPFGGRILSHDYVEAALMRRGGWEVWLAYDLEGSWEEGPPNLVEFAKRDRRWSQGNLQHSWLIAARGLFAVNRLHLATGILGYVGSLLWLFFLLTGTLIVYDFAHSGLSYIPLKGGLSSLWSGFAGLQTWGLLGMTAMVLFLPKCLAVVDAWLVPEDRKRFGGVVPIFLGGLMETFLSAIQAPAMMLYHSRFILEIALGAKVSWGNQARDAGDGVTWGYALRVQGWQLVIGVLWAWLCWVTDRGFFYWMSPVLAGMILSVPYTVWTSRTGPGRILRKLGIWLTPEEQCQPPELSELETRLKTDAAVAPDTAEVNLATVMIDPYLNGVHQALQRRRRDQVSKETREHFHQLANRLLSEGVESLLSKEQLALLRDQESVGYVHRQLWIRPAEELHESWNRSLREYNLHGVKPLSSLAF